MIGLVLTAGPWNSSRCKAGLDLSLTLASFDLEFKLFLLGDAAQCVIPTQEASKRFSALPLYGCDHWYVDQPGAFIAGTTLLTEPEMQQAIRNCQQVIRP